MAFLQNGSSLALLPFFYSFFNIFIRKKLKTIAGNINFVYLGRFSNVLFIRSEKYQHKFSFFARLYVYLLLAGVNVGAY